MDPKEVNKARLKEIEYAERKSVWRKIPRSEARRRGWKVLKTRWIDINKGDEEHPNYRSRFVAKEFNTGEVDGLFAVTPPLEALKLLVSEAATGKRGQRYGSVIMINDVARAFFEAPTKRDICIELPAETMTEEDIKNDMVGKLEQSLYGTRDAAISLRDRKVYEGMNSPRDDTIHARTATEEKE